MAQKLNVWVAERNLKNACDLKKYLEQREKIHEVRVFSKGQRVYQLLKEEEPDMMILDTELEDVEGFALLDSIIKEKGRIAFPFMMVSSESQEMLIRKAAGYGAVYYLRRPYYQESIYHRIIRFGNGTEPILTSISEEKMRIKEERQLELDVTNLIRELGIPAHIKGYHYVRESIIMAVKDGSILNYITKMLYPAIAKKYRTTSSSVERAIRHAIELAFVRGQSECLQEMFGCRGIRKPTNSEFIALVADKMKVWYNM